MDIRAGIGSIKLCMYMIKEGVKPEIFHDFQNLLQTDLSLSEMQCFIDYAELDIGCYENKPVIRQRMELLFQLCGANKTALTLLELAFLEYMDSSLDELLSILFPGHKQGIRLLEAVKIMYPDEEYFAHMSEIAECRKILPLFLKKDFEDMEELFCSYRADTRLIAFLSQVDYIPEILKNSMEVLAKTSIPEPVVIHEEIIQEMTCFIRQNQNQNCGSIIILHGEEHMGKRFLIRYCAWENEKDLIMIDFEAFMDCSESELRRKKEALIREVLLLQAMLCIYYVSEKNNRFYREFIYLMKDFLERIDLIFLTSKENINLNFVFKQSVLNIPLKKCSYSDQLKVWKGFLQLYLPNFYIPELADKLLLPTGVVKKVIKKIALSPDRYTDTAEVWRLCYRFLEMEEISGMKKMETPYTMDTIKLDSYIKNILWDVCNQIKNRTQVFDIWNMRQLYPYGRCVSVLFTGPPGTGKTMAASVIANTVNMELYRIDLSQLVDKYIGETEKKLERIFLQAEKSRCILFFDEADSIFGRRSELNDSKDRFANTQVSYLLQKMEEYDGIVILASNYRENIDKAFIRRISYIVEFVNPDVNIRYEIWNSLFTEFMEYEGIDFTFLAKKFELSGAMIKNIVLKAAFFAASAHEPIGMKWILMALIQEYRKLGRQIQKEELGEYAFCIEEQIKQSGI